MYDIIIIGAGPAGASLARNLDKKFKVLLIDKRNLSENEGFKREKCCGGLLAPAAQKALAGQGLGIPNSVLTGPQTFSVKSVDFDNNLTRYYQRHYININREKFDRWLVSLVSDNVEMKFSAIYKSYEVDNNGFTVIYESNGQINKAKTSILIGADGASSRVRAQTFKKELNPKRYISIQEHFTTDKVMPCYVSVFDKDVSDFYSWIIQKSNELIVGTAIPEDRDTEASYKTLIEKLNKKGLITGSAGKRTGAVIMRPSKLSHIQSHKDGIALAGEAAGLISPSSAEGISYALLSGAALAESINKSRASFGTVYNRKLFKMKLNIFLKKIKVLLMYNKFSRKIIMKTNLLAMKIDTD